ncbi:MAG: hypothetical protein Q9M37_07130 [Desulfonauticus sp.]|nr:hypothetical protein [Desulfonauticus sp.]
MQELALENRVDYLEQALLKLARQARRSDFKIEILSDEMRFFKNEMRLFKDEMLDFKNEMKDFKDEMLDFKNEMKEFKDEMNKKWGDLANKLGTVAEDIVAPGIPFVIKKHFGFDVQELCVRRRKKLQHRVREYDVVAVAGKYIFVVDVKSTYRRHYIEEFERALNDFFVFFPEYEQYKLMPVVASFNLTEEIINITSSRNWLALHMFGDYLEFVNIDKVNV